MKMNKGYIDPKTVKSPAWIVMPGYPVVLHNGGPQYPGNGPNDGWALAELGNGVVGVRWNGGPDAVSFPNSRNWPTWTVLPPGTAQREREWAKTHGQHYGEEDAA
jgi:hypothetical protein